MRVTDGMKLFNFLEGDGTPFGVSNVRQQIKDVIVNAGWPKEWVDGYQSGFDAQVNTPNGSLLRAIRRLEDTDGGMTFIQADGHAMFQASGYRATQTPTVIFGDKSTELPYTLGMDMDYDDHQIWNEVSVTRRGGTEQVSNSTLSIDAYVKRGLTRSDTLHVSDPFASLLADGLVARYKDPHKRVDKIKVTPRVDPANLWPVVLTYDISQNVTINRRHESGNVDSLDSYIEGVEHDVTVGGKWDTTYRVSQYA
jgi:hypothetical protein